MQAAVLFTAVFLLVGVAMPATEELETNYQKLKDATAAKDAAVVKELAGQTCALARQEIQTPAPTDEDQKANWTARVAFAKEVELFTEYSLYATALVSPAAATKIDLLGRQPREDRAIEIIDDIRKSDRFLIGSLISRDRVTPTAQCRLERGRRPQGILRV